ncbi:hypothetical protein NKR23_g8964 [Pleurostoma richardsiae]|uniref:Uncharacterized protein n=1 Tax=Pleurostoma richardsiae TaxID=41990 RepID=A0AA38RGV7_9PEZI|nr:hypothetical protein NKR23_g8964 [Pleurostoma richardsiae]
MGLVHPLHVIATVKGRRRPIACLELPRADPNWDMVQVVRRILTYFKENQRYIDLDLAYAETVPDDEWSRDADMEYRRFLSEHKPLPTDRSREFDEELRKLDEERVAALVPKFPFVDTCLYLGAVSSDFGNGFLHEVCTRQWNSPPNWGGNGMWEPGCTVIDLTDHSYAFVIPAHQACGMARKRTYRNLRLRPLNGHQWLMAFGLEDEDPIVDIVSAYGVDGPSPVTSIEALREVWPSFPPELTSEDSDSECEEKDDDDETAQGDEDVDEEASVLKEKAPASRKRKRGSEPVDERICSTIQELLVSCPQSKLRVQKRNSRFRPLLKRYIQKHPEDFTAEHRGAVPLLLAVLTYSKTYVKDLDLSRLRDLSGDQVVELVKSVCAHNLAIKKRATKTLKMLNISFNKSLTPDHLASILREMTIYELIIWDNPGLPLEEVASIANGRISKLTSRAGFLAPLERWARQNYRTKKSLVPVQPPPPIAPTQTRIRQVVWMTLGTVEFEASKTRPYSAGLAHIPNGKLSLEILDVDTLAMLLHPDFHRRVFKYDESNTIWARHIALPHHDAWAPLAEVYTSVARIEEFMSCNDIADSTCTLTDRWPLVIPLMMATGNKKKKSEYRVSSAFPAEAFSLATREMQGGCILEWNSLPARGSYPIVHGEHTLVLLREPDHGRLRYGLVTRDREGRLEVLDPAAAATAADDAEAAQAWKVGVGALPTWTNEEELKEGEDKEKAAEQYRSRRDIMLLDPTAVEKIWAATTRLSAHKDAIWKKIRKLEDERKAKSST